MRRPFIAGNWKMHLDRASAVALAEGVAKGAETVDGVDLAVCPPSVYLDAVGKAIAGSKVALGAQNVYHQPKGAYTGEISVAMLCDLGCRYVILGHSERRHILGESSEEVNQKVHAALKAGLTPIVCLGEKLAEREGS
jgi:triosephosphate isomerase